MKAPCRRTTSPTSPRSPRGETIYKGWQASGYVTGTLFSLWDDEAVSLVVGGEVRREEIDDEPDPESQNDNVWGSTSALITAGKDTVREVFVELELPLLPPNTPLAEEVLLNLSSRYTDYNSYGDDWTERAQLSWQFNPWLRLRGTYGTSFRAPDLFEQFLGNETGFLGYLVDPCIPIRRRPQSGRSHLRQLRQPWLAAGPRQRKAALAFAPSPAATRIYRRRRRIPGPPAWFSRPNGWALPWH